MVIDCLLNQDVVLVCCEVEADADGQWVAFDVRWVQFNPAAYPQVLGTEQDLYVPKVLGAKPIRVRVPDENLSEVHTDVRFPVVAVDSGGGEVSAN